MLQAILESLVVSVLEFFPRMVGWTVLKALTFGRYRGFRREDLLMEGGVGLLAIAVACLMLYTWWRW